MIITNDNYTDVLLKTVPEFQDTFDEYIEEMDGKILGHLIIGDLYRFAENVYEHGKQDVFKHVIDFVNKAAISPDDYVQEIIHISFMEYVPSSNQEFHQAVLPLLNDVAREMYDVIVNWTPEKDIA